MCLKKILSIIILGLIMILGTSCSEHPCVGTWTGGTHHSSEHATLRIKKDGTFALTITPSPRSGLEYGPYTEYLGKWSKVSDNEIELISQKKIVETADSHSDPLCSEIFYFRQDGALCKGYKDYASPSFDMRKEK